MYPKIQFEFRQSLIAASAIHCVLRLRENEWRWSDYLVEITAYREEALRECSLKIIRKYVGISMKADSKYIKRVGVVE